ncbi:hypothetical protein PIIN_11639 [Serendipita indica DSM 11827]|uniref:Uncharacterized protein n=1 Tax=Serendipita indica (strain DSM 11827) TaxID=1109443 RepID=G4U268_SERID|nr:hypothetical protein PIIN_11639 [Serendipita indica DSM 11827]
MIVAAIQLVYFFSRQGQFWTAPNARTRRKGLTRMTELLR